MSKLTRLHEEFGQSMWYDNIARNLLESGEIQSLVDDGVRGLTSNPAIFQKAMTGSDVYDTQLRELVAKDRSAAQIYEGLAITDIQRAADILRPVYDVSDGADGYVSLEVSPLLASSTQQTIDEAARLWREVKRPNLMVKIPATPQGLPAIEESLANGLNINVTLIFSRDVYAQVMDAYFNGLQRRVNMGQPVNRIASVASFFVSRVDSLVDGKLDALDDPGAASLRGKAGIANAKLAYALFKKKFSGAAWESLVAHGARVQRPLWASTSTKDPAYPDTLYVDNLIGPQTVNTAPPETIEAWVDHGMLAATLQHDVEKARAQLDGLEKLGISMDAVTDQLLQEGVAKFEKPFNQLIDAIKQKAESLTGAAV